MLVMHFQLLWMTFDGRVLPPISIMSEPLERQED
jgi:hypothetical protein